MRFSSCSLNPGASINVTTGYISSEGQKMPREFRQCWAYYDGNRCSLRAGHQGDHVRKITWTDADCQGAPLIEVLAVDEPVPFVPVQQPNPVGKCVACNHSHSGECKCGCKEFIG